MSVTIPETEPCIDLMEMDYCECGVNRPSGRHRKEECMCVNCQCHLFFMCLYVVVSNYCSCMFMYKCQSVDRRL